jgi:antitoxin ParD1/3/4
VIRAGLRALQERDAAVERWLREEVATTYDRWKAGPAGALSPEDMAERMRQRHAARGAGGAGSVKRRAVPPRSGNPRRSSPTAFS